MWESRRLIILWSSTACYRNSFNCKVLPRALEYAFKTQSVYWSRLCVRTLIRKKKDPILKTVSSNQSWRCKFSRIYAQFQLLSFAIGATLLRFKVIKITDMRWWVVWLKVTNFSEELPASIFTVRTTLKTEAAGSPEMLALPSPVRTLLSCCEGTN
jgi:hypothetical protein